MKKLFVVSSVSNAGSDISCGVLSGRDILPVTEEQVDALGVSREMMDLHAFEPIAQTPLISMMAIRSMLPGFEDCSIDSGRGEIRESSLWVVCHGTTSSLLNLLKGMMEDSVSLTDNENVNAVAEFLGADMVQILSDLISSEKGSDAVQAFAINVSMDASNLERKPVDPYKRQEWLTDEAVSDIISHYIGGSITLLDGLHSIPSATEKAIVYFEEF